MKTKICNHCGIEKLEEDFYFRTSDPAQRRATCKLCYHERGVIRKYNRYNLTAVDFQDILEKQEGVCAICKQPETITNRSLSIDHDHRSNLVRGLLCSACNQALGRYESSKERFEDYLDNNLSYSRPERHEWLMSLASEVATRGTCPRAKVGAILVVEGRIVSTGYVGSPSGQPHCDVVGCEIGSNGGCIRTIHAEANAVSIAAKFGTRLIGAEVYCTYSPCLDCAKLLLSVGISSFYYHKAYRDSSGLEMLSTARIEAVQL